VISAIIEFAFALVCLAAAFVVVGCVYMAGHALVESFPALSTDPNVGGPFVLCGFLLGWLLIRN
jgi:hypothetical protein